MDRPRVALLNASYDAANTRRNFRRELHASVEEFDVTDGHVPADPDHDAVGGTVEAMDDREMGYREVYLTRAGGSDPVFAGIESPFLAFTTHGDAVVDLPEGATRLAENDYGLQAFRHGSAVGVQFHPEYDRRTAREVTRGKDLPEERIESVLAGITERNYERASRTKALFANFVEAVGTRAAD